MAKHTAESVAALIESRIESDLPDKVLEALRPMDGKAITTRLLDKLPGGREQWRLVRHYGWTSLQTMGYGRNESGGEIDLTLVRSESSLPLELEWVEKENPAYFAARRERNEARKAALVDVVLLEDVAEAMNRAEQAIETLRRATADMEEFTDYGKPFNADSYTLREACGLCDKDGRSIISRDYKG